MLPWSIPPSPNIPGLFTCHFYTGKSPVLLEMASPWPCLSWHVSDIIKLMWKRNLRWLIIKRFTCYSRKSVVVLKKPFNSNKEVILSRALLLPPDGPLDLSCRAEYTGKFIPSFKRILKMLNIVKLGANICTI